MAAIVEDTARSVPDRSGGDGAPTMGATRSDRVRSTSHRLYGGASTITGPLVEGDRVRYRDVVDRRSAVKLKLLLTLHLLIGVTLIGWLVWPSHLPSLTGTSAISA